MNDDDDDDADYEEKSMEIVLNSISYPASSDLITTNSGPNINKDFYEKKGPEMIKKIPYPQISGSDLIKFSQSSVATSITNNASNQTDHFVEDLPPVSELLKHENETVETPKCFTPVYSNSITSTDSMTSYRDSSEYGAAQLPDISALNINGTEELIPQFSALIPADNNKTTQNANTEQINDLTLASATNLSVLSSFNIPNIARLRSPSDTSTSDIPNISTLIPCQEKHQSIQESTDEMSNYNIPQISRLNNPLESSVQSSSGYIPNFSQMISNTIDSTQHSFNDSDVNIPAFLLHSQNGKNK